MRNHVRCFFTSARVFFAISPANSASLKRPSSIASTCASSYDGLEPPGPPNEKGREFLERIRELGFKAHLSRGELRVLNPVVPQLFHRLSVRSDGSKRVERFARRASYAYQLDAFAAAVLRGEPVKTTPEDAVENMTVIDAIYRAAGLPLREPT